jgi:hypothetical protein
MSWFLWLCALLVVFYDVIFGFGKRGRGLGALTIEGESCAGGYYEVKIAILEIITSRR